MDYIKVSEAAASMKLYGRTYPYDNVLYFNWTCSGFSVGFKGKNLIAKFKVLKGYEIMGMPGDESAPKRDNYPVIGIFLDHATEPYKVVETQMEEEEILLFHSDEEESHVITVRKYTENDKGKMGLMGFFTDGILRPAEVREKRKIQFIGDSITCGFGNKADNASAPFITREEDGWMSYGALVARKLDMEADFVSVSGITLCNEYGDFKFPNPGMNELYFAEDWLLERELKITNHKMAAFEKTYDYVVVNLGTNDITLMELNKSVTEANLQKYEECYLDFIAKLRGVHGNNTKIICTFGTMDYYLYPQMLNAVNKYVERTGDKNVDAFRYRRIPFDEGLGACGHPSVKTHIRMAEELVEFILR